MQFAQSWLNTSKLILWLAKTPPAFSGLELCLFVLAILLLPNFAFAASNLAQQSYNESPIAASSLSAPSHLGLAAAPPINHIRFKRYLTGDNLNQVQNINAITDITQDRYGLIWLAGENGLARFDGTGFDVFQTDSRDPLSISSSYIWDLQLDKAGNLWIATGRGINRFDHATETFNRYWSMELGANVEFGRGLQDDAIFALACDQENGLWLGGAEGLYYFRPDRQAFISHPGFVGQSIRALHTDEQGNLWVGTSEWGLALVKNQQTVERFWREQEGNMHSLPNNYVRSIEQDQLGRIWVGTLGGGVARLNEDGKSFKRYQHQVGNANSLASNSIWDIHRDRHGYLWVATDPGGLALYQPESDNFRVVRNRESDLSSLSSDKVRAIFDDDRGDLWVGLFPNGVNYFDKSTAAFANFSHDSNDENSLSHSGILAILEDSKKRIWVGTEGGLNLFDLASRKFKSYRSNLGKEGELQADPILAIEEDSAGDLWLGTWSGGVHRFNPETERFTAYILRTNKNERGGAYIWSLLNDSQGRLWLGTETKGLNLYQAETDSFIEFSPDPQRLDSLSFPHVWSLLEDSKGNIWVGTIDGLNKLLYIDDEGAHFQHFFNDPSNAHSLSSNRIISLLEDSDGYIWVGTQDAGLNRLQPESGQVLRFGREQGLPSAHVSSLLRDHMGYLWVTTVNGVARINPKTFDLKILSKSDGLVGNNFNRNASALLHNKQLLLGAAEGLSLFKPDIIQKNEPAPEVLITELRVLNNRVLAGEDNEILSNNISDTQELHLRHTHNMLAFDFVALDYRAPQLNQFAYMLEGFDRDWNYVGSQNSATYTNLDPGIYLFKVKAATASGDWNAKPQSITLNITPPVWQSVGAYFIYFLSLLFLIYYAFKANKKKLEFEHQKSLATKLLKLDRMKDAFLANTSHELRTPLNGIIGLAESMMEGATGPVSPAMHHNLKMISSSGRRLSSLINDILDYSKLNEQKLQANIQPVNLNIVVDSVIELLQPLVGKKPLTINNTLKQPVSVLADEDRMQQVLLNLIGNAIKFSEQGSVSISAQLQEDDWSIAISDTGPGIADKDLEKIFQAFTQLDDDETRAQGGTGLGLAITKQLIELQGGSIKVQSQMGLGSTFTILMRACDEHSVDPNRQSFNPEVQDTTARLNNIVETDRVDTLSLLRPAEHCRNYVVLIVDDDAVNRMVLKGILSLQEYQVLEADSGIEALEVLESEQQVDIIILDVMMPKMSGYETCMRIRTDKPPHVLPILFLTAKNFSDDLVRGFVAGGNDFLTKPVSKHELLSRVSTHLSLLDVNRKLVRKAVEGESRSDVSPQEMETLNTIIDNINREIDYKLLQGNVLTALQKLLNADKAIYWQLDDGEEKYCVQAEVGSGNSKLNVCIHNAKQLAKFLNERYLQDQVVLIVDKVKGETLASVKLALDDCSSSILMTIYFEGAVVGFITLMNDSPEKTFDVQAVAVLARVRAHVTSAIVKASLLQRLNVDAP